MSKLSDFFRNAEEKEKVMAYVAEESSREQEIVILKARIKELESGACRFNCRKNKKLVAENKRLKKLIDELHETHQT